MPDRKSPKRPTNEEFLAQVGQCVRGLRASRGMTRKQLSQDSSVSERYLADLEQGHGNISISLLRKVAHALGASLGELVSPAPRQSPEQLLINDYVGRLPRADQQSALHLLYREFAAFGDGHSRVALIGLRGAGKTTLGQLLQARQGLTLIRLAREIESIAGMDVGEILALSGQAGYRRLEEKALYGALKRHESCCIETGGSIVSELGALNLLLSTCLVVWVRTSPEEHMARVIAQGDLRPMADNDDAMEDLRRILDERTPYYEKAHIVLDTAGRSVESSYQELLKKLRERGLQPAPRDRTRVDALSAGG